MLNIHHAIDFIFGEKLCTFLTSFNVLINSSVLVTCKSQMRYTQIKLCQWNNFRFLFVQCVLLCCVLFLYVQPIKCIHCARAVNDTCCSCLPLLLHTVPLCILQPFITWRYIFLYSDHFVWGMFPFFFLDCKKCWTQISKNIVVEWIWSSPLFTFAIQLKVENIFCNAFL